MEVFGVLVAMAFAGFICFLLGFSQGLEDYSKEAFERGYMVECVGEIGYYWECE